MKTIANIFIGLTAIFHVLFFKLESIDFMKPEVLAKFGLDEISGVFAEPWAFNQGFYNLFFALGLFFSLFLINTGKIDKGKILASFILLSIVGAGIVLYISVPGKVVAATAQALPALLGFVFLRVSCKNSATY